MGSEYSKLDVRFCPSVKTQLVVKSMLNSVCLKMIFCLFFKETYIISSDPEVVAI
jgi:hypothetical protein